MFRAVLFAVLCGGLAMDLAAQKVGHIDKQALLLQMPERASIEQRIRDKAQELQRRIGAMEAELDTTVAIATRNAPKMTETEKTVAQRDIEQLAQRLDGARQQAGTDMERVQEELLTPVLARIDTAIAEIAAAGGFSYVLDTGSGTVLYFDKGIDLMPEVKAKLGIQTP